MTALHIAAVVITGLIVIPALLVLAFRRIVTNVAPQDEWLNGAGGAAFHDGEQ